MLCKCSIENKRGPNDRFKEAQHSFDVAVKEAKRQYWHDQQKHLLSINQNSEFWKTMGNVGISKHKHKNIPWEVILQDGSVSTNRDDVLQVWKSAFEQLLNTSEVNNEITIQEVRLALMRANQGKALGDDGIPVEVLHSNACVSYLVRLFNSCFQSASVPDVWSRGIITPILKNAKEDPRDPLNYRGITVTSAVYKLFCSVLNQRLTCWVDDNGIICDEQNGFRVGRSTVDHLSNLTSVIETRIKKRQNTCAVFIDFSKAYDRIDRTLLWRKLEAIGIDGIFLKHFESIILQSEMFC